MKFGPRAFHGLIVLLISSGAPSSLASVGDTQVCTWHGGQQCAFSLTYDDNRTDHINIAGPALTARGLQATFFVNPGFASWHTMAPSYAALVTQGHELGNHTMLHQRCKIVPPDQDPNNVYFHSLDELRQDCVNALAIIQSMQPDRPTVSFAYPGGVEENQTKDVIASFFYLARLSTVGVYHNKTTPQDPYLLYPDYVGNSATQDWWDYDYAYSHLTAYLDDAVASGGWSIEEAHDLAPPGYSSINLAAYYQHLDDLAAAVQAGHAWVAPTGDVMRYVLSRNAVAITPDTVGLNSASLTADDGVLADTLRVPVTLMTEIPDGLQATVTVNGAPIDSTTRVLLGKTWALYSVLASNAAVVVTWATTPPPGDMNCDGTVDAADIDPFFIGLASPASYAALYPNCDIMAGDVNGDGSFDAGDIDPFFQKLGGG